MSEPTIYETEHYNYILESELSELDQVLFAAWMAGQTRPLPVIDGKECWGAAYAHDYQRFVKQKGRPDSLATWD